MGADFIDHGQWREASQNDCGSLWPIGRKDMPKDSGIVIVTYPFNLVNSNI